MLARYRAVYAVHTILAPSGSTLDVEIARQDDPKAAACLVSDPLPYCEEIFTWSVVAEGMLNGMFGGQAAPRPDDVREIARQRAASRLKSLPACRAYLVFIPPPPASRTIAGAADARMEEAGCGASQRFPLLAAVPLVSSAVARRSNRPGASTDTTARVAAQGITAGLGQPVVVVNRTGAAGDVATEHVARSAPDSHTLVVASMGSHATNAALDPARAGVLRRALAETIPTANARRPRPSSPRGPQPRSGACGTGCSGAPCCAAQAGCWRRPKGAADAAKRPSWRTPRGRCTRSARATPGTRASGRARPRVFGDDGPSLHRDLWLRRRRGRPSRPRPRAGRWTARPQGAHPARPRLARRPGRGRGARGIQAPRMKDACNGMSGILSNAARCTPIRGNQSAKACLRGRRAFCGDTLSERPHL